MSAENLLLLLDECDEINIVMREAAPAVACALACLLVGLCVGWRTDSPALAAAASVTSAWLGLVVCWLRDRVRRVHAPVTLAPPRR